VDPIIPFVCQTSVISDVVELWRKMAPRTSKWLQEHWITLEGRCVLQVVLLVIAVVMGPIALFFCIIVTT